MGSKNIYITRQDISDRKRQWDTFERIENFNSIARNNLANSLPTATSQVFYNFVDNSEKLDYTNGQIQHVERYPDISDFLVPYSRKDIPYTPTVIAALQFVPSETILGPCPGDPVPKSPAVIDPVGYRKSRDVYVRVSTQQAQFPKSPYKFGSNQEYLLYKKFQEWQS
jgi:hypothetical protein